LPLTTALRLTKNKITDLKKIIMKKIFQLIPVLFFSLASHLALAQCQSPANLTTSYNNNVSTFAWDAVPGATGYKFELKFQWDPWTSAYVLTASTNSITLTGIFQSAPLEWRVSTDCGNGSYSAPTATTYTVPCPQPSNPVTSNITATTATVSWTAAPGYNTTVSDFAVGYRLANTNNAWTSAGHTSSTSKILTGLLSNTAYEFCVNQSCMYFNSTPLTGTFTTAFIACNIPTSISVTNAGSSQATVSWTIVSGGLSYTVEYKPTTGTVWSSVNSTTNTILLTGLNSATLYDVRVKANCTAASSNYIASQFTTYSSSCPAWGVNGSEFIDLFSLGSINRTSAREVGGYYNTGLSTNLARGSNNAGQFSAGYNPGIIFNENFAVYIDFNRNGSFADGGERVVNPTAVNSGATIYNFNVAIPNNASTGATKMRVIICRTGTTITPCSFTGFKGEVEDYDVTIVNSNSNRSNGSETEGSSDKEPVQLLSAYPNPSAGIFTIQLPPNVNASYYEIINSNGTVVEKKNIQATNSFRINMSAYSNGLYLLNVISSENNKRYTRKLNLVR
jgi:hypothetical protein